MAIPSGTGAEHARHASVDPSRLMRFFHALRRRPDGAFVSITDNGQLVPRHKDDGSSSSTRSFPQCSRFHRVVEAIKPTALLMLSSIQRISRIRCLNHAMTTKDYIYLGMIVLTALAFYCNGFYAGVYRCKKMYRWLLHRELERLCPAFRRDG